MKEVGGHGGHQACYNVLQLAVVGTFNPQLILIVKEPLYDLCTCSIQIFNTMIHYVCIPQFLDS